jgi:lipopolysaccharide biosynthesis regulator YciM
MSLKRFPSTYIEGLNFLLNEEKDKAIDVLVKLSVNEPDSVELQFAVGSLFRSNGEIQRGVSCTPRAT